MVPVQVTRKERLNIRRSKLTGAEYSYILDNNDVEQYVACIKSNNRRILFNNTIKVRYFKESERKAEINIIPNEFIEQKTKNTAVLFYIRHKLLNNGR